MNRVLPGEGAQRRQSPPARPHAAAFRPHLPFEAGVELLPAGILRPHTVILRFPAVLPGHRPLASFSGIFSRKPLQAGNRPELFLPVTFH
ncbi:hypothetical protein ADH72_05665 [Akkermansia muciniphila]|nr:hypothetical protein A4V05_09945 [Akkermansia muciniphila]ASB35216.1 hypothetical protein ADH72_05665 [Akkermansia muciniphila]